MNRCRERGGPPHPRMIDLSKAPLGGSSAALVSGGPNGQPQMLKPTPQMLDVLEHFEREGHGEH